MSEIPQGTGFLRKQIYGDEKGTAEIDYENFTFINLVGKNIDNIRIRNIVVILWEIINLLKATIENRNTQLHKKNILLQIVIWLLMGFRNYKNLKDQT